MINTLSVVDSYVVTGLLAHDIAGGFLGDFLRSSKLIDSDKQAAQFVRTLVNDDIERLPGDQQQMLADWASRKLMTGNRKPADLERRAFMKLSTKALLAGAMSGSSNPSAVGSLGDLAMGAGFAASALLGERKAMQCDAVFRQKLPLWLKEHHAIELDLPPHRAR